MTETDQPDPPNNEPDLDGAELVESIVWELQQVAEALRREYPDLLADHDPH